MAAGAHQRMFTRFSRALHAIFTPALLHCRIDLCEQDKDEAVLLVPCAGQVRLRGVEKADSHLAGLAS